MYGWFEFCRKFISIIIAYFGSLSDFKKAKHHLNLIGFDIMLQLNRINVIKVDKFVLNKHGFVYLNLCCKNE